MNTEYIYYHLLVAASGSDDSTEAYVPIPADSSPYEVVSAVFVPNVAVTAHGSNHWTVALKATDGEAGTPGASMGGFSTDSGSGGASLAAGDKVAITVSAAAAQAVAGGAIQIDVNEGGTAPANLDGCLCIGIRKLPPA